jgi:hypothetical protein
MHLIQLEDGTLYVAKEVEMQRGVLTCTRVREVSVRPRKLPMHVRAHTVQGIAGVTLRPLPPLPFQQSAPRPRPRERTAAWQEV